MSEIKIDVEFLHRQGEWFAAGFFEKGHLSPFRRLSLAVRRQLENAFLPAYQGQPLYPAGVNTFWQTRNNVLTFHYAYSLVYNRQKLISLIEGSSSKDERKQWQQLLTALDSYPLYSHQLISAEFTVGGRGWTHSIPNYGRVLREGLRSYKKQIQLIEKKWPGDICRQDLASGLQDVLSGINCLHRRLRETLPKNSSLYQDYLIVPWAPARNFRQALLATNFIFYLDGCDSLGRLDMELAPYYQQDLKKGLITEKQAISLLQNLWKNFDANSAWNVVVGGSLPGNRPAYNRFTEVCLKSAAGFRRPNLALRMRRDIPDKYLEAALDTIGSGCGNPAVYNEELYLQALEENHLHINHEDLYHYAFGGCTETMVHGMSNVGSLDGGLNLVGIMSKTLKRMLPQACCFQEIVTAFKEDITQAVETLVSQVNYDQQHKAIWRPQVIRTLLVDDCLASGREFNSGGARYNWSVINVGGLANVADSLLAVKKLVFEEKYLGGKQLQEILEQDFQNRPDILQKVKQYPRYGNDEDEVDCLAIEVSDYVFQQLTSKACWRGGRFLPGCLLFVTYVAAGETVPATPDGRRKGQPIADSIGPYSGREKKGPTAMLKSVAKLHQKKAAGTLVLNIRLSKNLFTSPAGRKAVKNLIRTYFSLGGMQIQLNVVDQKILKEALEQPEKFPDLIVRVGGYSEYFNRLDRKLQQTIIARTEFNL